MVGARAAEAGEELGAAAVLLATACRARKRREEQWKMAESKVSHLMTRGTSVSNMKYIRLYVCLYRRVLTADVAGVSGADELEVVGLARHLRLAAALAVAGRHLWGYRRESAVVVIEVR